MSAAAERADLIVLVAGKNDEAVLRSLLGERRGALGIRTLRFDIEVHPRRDPGCLNEGPAFLGTLAGQYEHALLVFDRVGSGRDAIEAIAIEAIVNDALARAGWGDRAATLVIDPELEVWLWSDSPHVDATLGWAGRAPSLREWLKSTRQWLDTPKPPDPKGAVEAALREARISRSSSIYGEIAAKVSIERCRDPSFGRFKSIMSRWFGAAL